MTTSRRRFLAAISAAASATTTGLISLSPWAPCFLTDSAALGAETQGEKILVVVQLSGGNDGLNTVIPYRDERYKKNRPSLAQDPASVVKLSDDLALHPNLKRFESLLEAKQLAIWQGVGYPNPNRSHFESMDIWHTARPDLSHRTTGWLGRSLDVRKQAGQADSQAAIHLGSEVQPLALAGREIQCPSIRSLEQFQLDVAGKEHRRALLESILQADRTSSNDLLKFVSASATSALEVSRRMEVAKQDYKTSVTYPETLLAQKMRQIAQLVDAGLTTRIYYVALDGFDTHSDQANAHAALLDQMGGALAAFTEDLAAHGHLDRIATVVFSEFGRRVKENSSRGTDHGAAAPVFVLGGKVRSGVTGNHPDLSDLDDGDLKYHTDFRSIYASLLQDWLGWPIEPALGDSIVPAKLFT